MNKDILLMAMQYCRNHFIKERKAGRITIKNDKLMMTGVNTGIANAGQYIIIAHSDLNGGIYRIQSVTNGALQLDTNGIDEEFFGVTFFLQIPPSFILLCKKIEVYEQKNAGKSSNIASEHFGDYSVSYNSGVDGTAYTWQDEFKNDLRNFRRIFADIEV